MRRELHKASAGGGARSDSLIQRGLSSPIFARVQQRQCGLRRRPALRCAALRCKSNLEKGANKRQQQVRYQREIVTCMVMMGGEKCVCCCTLCAHERGFACAACRAAAAAALLAREGGDGVGTIPTTERAREREGEILSFLLSAKPKEKEQHGRENNWRRRQ